MVFDTHLVYFILFSRFSLCTGCSGSPPWFLIYHFRFQNQRYSYNWNVVLYTFPLCNDVTYLVTDKWDVASCYKKVGQLRNTCSKINIIKQTREFTGRSLRLTVHWSRTHHNGNYIAIKPLVPNSTKSEDFHKSHIFWSHYLTYQNSLFG